MCSIDITLPLTLGRGIIRPRAANYEDVAILGK
jgi:hypothetical protein